MAITRWQPFRELSTIRQQLDRLFEDMASGDHDWLGIPSSMGIWFPAVEIKETDKELILKAEIPGMDAQDLEVEVTEDQVTLSGEHKEESNHEEKDKNFFRSEFHYGEFKRVVPLPMLIKTDKIQSDFQNGVLTLTMPKMENSPKKVVKVNVTNNSK
ncbi:molecular chaperone (small heat shock protein) [Xenococcus sp. PCC 7305]|nr:molecular chaperone (small heat shock protein) [Xenococcus sp. PCC 7305]